jgi:NAD(P)H-hydrate epimerase
MSARLWEAMAAPVDGWAALRSLCEGKRAVGFGPGVARTPSGCDMLRGLLREGTVPVVVDATGLDMLDQSLLDPGARSAPLVLTPHPGEAARLSGRSVTDIQRDRIGWAREWASRCGAFVALKGARTVVAAPDGRAWINPTGNEGMASGGTGDVLLGVVASLLAQGAKLPEALLCGVYVHGRAGDLAAKRRGSMGLIARDVIEGLPAALAALTADG